MTVFKALPAGDHLPALVAVLLASVLACVALFYFLHRTLGPRGRRRLTMAVTFLAGLYLGLEYFLPVREAVLWPTRLPNTHPSPANLLTPGIEPFSVWLTVAGAFTVGLGIYSLFQFHGRNVLRRTRGWPYGLSFFIATFAMFTFTIWDHSLTKAGLAPEAMPWPRAVYEFLFTGIYVPLQAATFSLLAFYIASAAYRAFRIQTAEASVMMVAAFIVMLGQVPIGSWLTSTLPTSGPLAFFHLEALGEWVMRWLNTPAQRAITLGIAVGALAMSLRIWLSLERGTFFSER
jgi:hypothetical protein